MKKELPTVLRSGTMEFLGHRLTLHVLSDATRVFEDTPALRAMYAEIGVTITDGGIYFGLEAPIEAEVVK